MTHRQRLSMIVVTLLAAFGLVATGANPAGAAPSAPAAVPPAVDVTTPITGSFTDASGGTGSFVGTFTPTSFAESNSDLMATGVLTGTMTDSAGSTVGTVTQTVDAPTTFALATCRILDLVLGPLHLDLLGLTVDLNQVHLVINAVSGAGNLLGNLLCAIAGLLDGNPTAGALAALLNSLLALLGQR